MSARAPLLGLDRFTSAISASPGRRRAASASSGAAASAASRSTSARGVAAWASARSSRTPATISSSTVGMWTGYPAWLWRPCAGRGPDTSEQASVGLGAGARLGRRAGRGRLGRAVAGHPQQLARNHAEGADDQANDEEERAPVPHRPRRQCSADEDGDDTYPRSDAVPVVLFVGLVLCHGFRAPVGVYAVCGAG